MLALALAVATLAPFEPIRKASMSLTELVDAASFICIGVVDEVVPVSRPAGVPDGEFRSYAPPSLTFARIRVERVIKGDAATRVLYHEAWSTWMCDSTRDAVGERSLFLLGPGLVSSMTEPQRQLVESTLCARVILKNVHSGDGIIPIRGSGDREYVYCHPCPEAWAVPDDPYAIRWKPVLSFVETLAPFSPQSVALLAQRVEGAGSFDLRVLPDGRRRLATSYTMNETVACDQFEIPKWELLQSELRKARSDKSRVGGSDRSWSERRLLIRDERGTFEFVQPHEFDLHTVAAEERAAWSGALEAWAVVRGSMECGSCFDDRDEDRRLLDEWARK